MVSFMAKQNVSCLAVSLGSENGQRYPQRSRKARSSQAVDSSGVHPGGLANDFEDLQREETIY